MDLKTKMMISIIVPCLNEEEVLPLFYQSVEALLPDLGAEVEYVFVDDGSNDGTLELLKAYREQNPAVRYVSFSRNFGKEAALYAGLQHATGDLVVVMDADLQDPPSMLLEMKALLDQNADLDCVGTRRTSREGEPFFRSFCADVFYRLMQKISPVALPSGVRDFRMMRRSVVDAILSLTESNRFSKGLFAWVGFKTHYLDYPNVERQAGKTSWSFRQLFFYPVLRDSQLFRFSLEYSLCSGTSILFYFFCDDYFCGVSDPYLGKSDIWLDLFDGCHSFSWRDSTPDHWNSRQVYQ